jgi:hypothetical protein
MVAAANRKLPGKYDAEVWQARISGWIAAGWTREAQLAGVANVDPSTVNRFRNGKFHRDTISRNWLESWRDCELLHQGICEVCRQALAEPDREAPPVRTDLDGDGDTDRDDEVIALYQLHKATCRASEQSTNTHRRAPEDSRAEAEMAAHEGAYAFRQWADVHAAVSGFTSSPPTSGRGVRSHGAASVFSQRQ